MIAFKNHKHHVAMLLAVIIAMTLLFSSFFVLTHLNHDYPGTSCVVCSEIRTCIRTVHLLSEALGSGIVLIFAYFYIKNQVKKYNAGNLSPRVTLVRLKVRFNH
jgi:hypothetical protein